MKYSCVGRGDGEPKQFGVIRKSVKKTDRNDARALAFFLSRDMLPETRVKTVCESELASLTHTRDLLVKQRTRLLNKIHALHTRHGIKLKKEKAWDQSVGLPSLRLALLETRTNRVTYCTRPGLITDGCHCWD